MLKLLPTFLMKNIFKSNISRNIPVIFKEFSSKSTRGRILKPLKKNNNLENIPGPKTEITSVEDSWTEVVDKASGQTYFWNQQTNETTALGAPRPSAAALSHTTTANPPQSQSLGSVVAEGSF
jgi:hypothetical protein